MKLMAKIFIAMTVGLLLSSDDAEACTRVVYVGDNNEIVTGRTLDWKEPIGTNLYVMPRGMEREGYDESNTVKWISKYGSVVSVGYDVGVNEGMNEMGLVCNLLYLPGTVYSLPNDTRPYMSTSVWAQYVLDNFATTSEAVAELSKDKFQINAPSMPGGNATTLHMAISDASGNSAIIEYINGVISIHEGAEFQVMTNAPTYDKQLAINEYWSEIGGLKMLPGTNKSSDRFVRASFYVKALPKKLSHQMALAGVFGIINNCSVPMGISTPDQPEISSTQWRSVSDQKDKVYYFESTLSPAIIWVDLSKCDLRKGASVLKLDLINNTKTLVGEMNSIMVKSKPFKPMFHVPENFKL